MRKYTVRRRRVEEHAQQITIPPEARPYLQWTNVEQLTCRQAAILAVVTANPGVTVGAVATVLNMHKPTVTRAADKLTDWGLLFRSQDSDDRRLALLFPGRKPKQPAPARTGRSTRGGG